MEKQNKKPRFKTIIINFKLKSEVKTNTGKAKMKPQNFQNKQDKNAMRQNLSQRKWQKHKNKKKP